MKSQITALQTAVAGLQNTTSIIALQTDLTAIERTTAPPNTDTPGIGEFIPNSDGWLKVDRPLQIGTAVIYKSKKCCFDCKWHNADRLGRRFYIADRKNVGGSIARREIGQGLVQQRETFKWQSAASVLRSSK